MNKKYVNSEMDSGLGSDEDRRSRTKEQKQIHNQQLLSGCFIDAASLSDDSEVVDQRRNDERRQGALLFQNSVPNFSIMPLQHEPHHFSYSSNLNIPQFPETSTPYNSIVQLDSEDTEAARNKSPLGFYVDLSDVPDTPPSLPSASVTKNIFSMVIDFEGPKKEKPVKLSSSFTSYRKPKPQNKSNLLGKSSGSLSSSVSSINSNRDSNSIAGTSRQSEELEIRPNGKGVSLEILSASLIKNLSLSSKSSSSSENIVEKINDDIDRDSAKESVEEDHIECDSMPEKTTEDVVSNIQEKENQKLDNTVRITGNKTDNQLMSKLAPLLGRDVTERVFLARFTELCSSPKFYIRQVCAEHFGNFCAVISKDAVEKLLLPQYLALCTDGVWGVRKACAEVVCYLACACGRDSNTEKLAPAFGALLQDDSRWVKVAAFHWLGPFISTFADPPITSMGYNSNGDLTLTSGDGGEFSVVCSPCPVINMNMDRRTSLGSTLKEDSNVMMNPLNIDFEDNFGEENLDGCKCDNCDSENINNDLKDEMQNIKLVVNTDNCTNVDSEILNNSVENSNASKDTNDNEKKVNNINNYACDAIEDDLHLFNSHNYWYISPDLPLDPHLVAAGHDVANVGAYGDSPVTANENDVKTTVDNNNSTISLNENEGADDSVIISNSDVKPEREQTIVPQIIIDSFVSMTYPIFLNFENEMAYHCAYSLPAVVRTLGSENWSIIEDTVYALAVCVQYKVRRTVASSLHELAIILGPELATNSLTPLFDEFIKDLDEVRIGILKHLSSFLRAIISFKRNTYLPRLIEFLQNENEPNWRFREELAMQLLDSIDLFKPSDVAKHIGFIAIDLLSDKVAAVRTASLSLVTALICYVSSEPSLTSTLLVKLAENFAHSKRWKRRQTFCLMCIELLKQDSLDPELFVSEVMPHLLDLSWDPVANIRLVVARCISNYILKNEFFIYWSNENCDGLETVLRRLQADKDCDVRQSAEI